MTDKKQFETLKPDNLGIKNIYACMCVCVRACACVRKFFLYARVSKLCVNARIPKRHIYMQVKESSRCAYMYAHTRTYTYMNTEATARQIARALEDSVQLVVVHGAGSFGHWQAREHGTKNGWFHEEAHSDAPNQAENSPAAPADHRDNVSQVARGVADHAGSTSDSNTPKQPQESHNKKPRLMASEGSNFITRQVGARGKVQGFAAVRRSVCQLNSTVVSELVKYGVPSVGMPPFPSWECDDGKLKIGRADLVCYIVCVCVCVYIYIYIYIYIYV